MSIFTYDYFIEFVKSACYVIPMKPMKSFMSERLKQLTADIDAGLAEKESRAEYIKDTLVDIRDLSLGYMRRAVADLKPPREGIEEILGECSVPFNKQWNLRLILEHVGLAEEPDKEDDLFLHYQLKSRTDSTVHEIADLRWGVYNSLKLVHKGIDVEGGWIEGKPLTTEETAGFMSDVTKLLSSWLTGPNSRNEVSFAYLEF